MMNRFYKLNLGLIIVFLFAIQGYSQILLNPDPNLMDPDDIPANCQVIQPFSVLEFQKTDPAPVIDIERNGDIVFTTTELNFEYYFEPTATYVILYNKLPAACFVVPRPVPTLGEWSVIILSLLMSIVGAVYIYNRKPFALLTAKK